MNIINGLLLILYTLVYSIKNYNSIFSIIISFFIILFLFGRILIKNKCIYSKKNKTLSLIFSIVISLFTICNFNFEYKMDKLSLKNISDTPITVEGVYFDEQLVKLKYTYSKKYDAINNASLRSEYQLYNKMDDSYKMTLYPNKTYDFDISKVKDIRIDFQRGEQISNIEINQKKYTIDSYIFSDNTKANKIYDSSFKYRLSNLSTGNLFITIGMFLISIYLYFNLIIRVIGDKKNLLLLLGSLIIEFNYIIHISNFSKIIFILFILLLTNLKLKIKKVNKKQKVFFFISSLYIAFSFIGDRIINNKFSFRILIVYLLTMLFVYLLFPYMIGFIDYLKSKVKIESKDNKNIWKHRIIVFAITLGICLFYHYIFYPYIIHTDGYMEIMDVVNNKYSNWHPYFHIIMLKAFYLLFGNVKYFLYLRLIMYSLLLNCILFYFNRRGLTLKKVYLISILFTIFPVTGVMLVTLVKDIDFSLALVALSFYLFLIIKDYDYFKKNRMNYIYMAFSLFLVAVLRHNGIYIYIITFIFLCYFILKYKKNILSLSLFLSLLFVFLIKVPLYQALEVEDAPRNFDIAPLIHGLNYLVVEDKNIDKNTLEYLDTQILSEDKIVRYYDKYNIDLFLHYIKDDDVRDKKINKIELVGMYTKQLFITPISLIQDRLYGSDMMWNVSEKDGIRFYKYQTVYDEFDTNYRKLLKEPSYYNSFLSRVVNRILIFISNNEFLNLLFFRSGIYIDLLIVLINYCLIKKRKEIFSSIPIIVNVLTLFIAMAHQEYRYIWMIELVVCFLWLMVIYDQKEKE